MRHLSPSLTHGYGRAGPTKSTLSASDDAWRCQAPASCQSLDQQACATARSRSSRCMALSYLLLLVPKCVPWPTPVHTHRAAVGAARALLQVFRSLAAVCSPSIVAFDFRFSDRSFSATLCEKDNPERKPPSPCVRAPQPNRSGTSRSLPAAAGAQRRCIAPHGHCGGAMCRIGGSRQAMLYGGSR